MTDFRRHDYHLPIFLILFVSIPIGAGLVRLLQISGVPLELQDTARVLSSWRPALVLHISGNILFLTLGAFQFSQYFRAKHRNWHRVSGRIAAASGAAAALAALWLSLLMPPATNDSTLLLLFRVSASTGILVTIILGYLAARAGKFSQHRAWMMRGYALASGTGLQAFLTAGWEVGNGQSLPLERALIFGASWLTCLIFAEWRILKKSSSRIPN